jgi:TRAP transporter TAXI family solute receptor
VVAGYSSTLQMAVHKGSAFKSVADLKGKRIGVLSGITMQDWFPRIADVFGIKGQFKAFALRPAELQNSLRDGNIDASIYWGSAPASVLTDLTTAKPIRFLPVPATQAKNTQETHPYFFEKPLAKGTYNGIEADVPSLGVPILLVTRTGVSEDLAYNITKALMENNDALGKIHPKAAEFAIANAGKSMVIPPHPGVVRYFKEKGVTLK